MTDQIQRLQLQQYHSKVRYHRDQVQAQRSTTAAAEIGKLLKCSLAWTDSNRSLKLYEMLDVKDSTVTELIEKLLRSLRHSWGECMQLEIEERAKMSLATEKGRSLI